MLEHMNYHEMMEKTLASLGEKKPRLLLHACCAPCASWPLELLSDRSEITVYYYNPNIMPLEEYEKRLGEFEKLRRFPFRFLDNSIFSGKIFFWNQSCFTDGSSP